MWLAAWWRVPAPFPAWGAPDLLLLVLLAWVFAQKAAPAWPKIVRIGAGLGVLKDLATGGPFGAWTAVFVGTAWLATQGARTIARDHPVAQLWWVAVYAAIATLGYAVLLGVRGEGSLALQVVAAYLVPSAVLTGAASLILFPALTPPRVRR